MLTPREVASAGECSNTGIHQPPSSDAQVPMLTPSEVASAQQCPAQGHSRVSLPFSTRLCKLIGFAAIPMISKPVSHPHARYDFRRRNLALCYSACGSPRKRPEV